MLILVYIKQYKHVLILVILAVSTHSHILLQNTLAEINRNSIKFKDAVQALLTWKTYLPSSQQL